MAATVFFALALAFRRAVDEHEASEEDRVWASQARQQRLVVLQDLVRRLDLPQLCAACPDLRCYLHSSATIALGLSEQFEAAATREAIDVECDFPVKAEAVAEAAEKLAKVDRGSAAVRGGFAIATALECHELAHALSAYAAAQAGCCKKEEPASLTVAALATAAEAEAEALQRCCSDADELLELVRVHCADWGTRRDLQALCNTPRRAAALALRRRRMHQWRCVAGLLLRFRSSLPFMGLSSMLSVVLGAFSAMRLHYQAALITLARDAATGAAQRRGGIREAVLAMLVSEVISQFADFGRARLAALGKTRVVRELKVALFEALLRQDLEYLEHCDLHQMRSMIGSCGTTVGQVVDFPAICVEAFVRTITAVAALWNQSPRLAAFLLLALPLRQLGEKGLDALSEYLQLTTGAPDFRGQINACWSTLVRPASLRTMRTFAREPTEVMTFARFLAAHDRMQDRGQFIYRAFQPLRSLLTHGVEIGALWQAGQLAARGELDVGNLASFMMVAQDAFDGSRFAHAAASSVSSHVLGPLAQMAALLARTPSIGLDHPPIEVMPDPMEVRWQISFLNVFFAYPSRPGAWVLQGLSFDANAGEFLGIVGTTGAGKSTIFALLLRLYEPSSGRILLDGRDLREYNPLWLRRHIGLVSQDLVLCQKTIRENLDYGCCLASTGGILAQPPSDEAARAALRAAQCEATFFDTAAFPSQWHTAVGDGGSDLSGGQRQRLGVARALLKHPRLLLLDEATSALDEVSQANLQSAVQELRKAHGVTVLCVAHRLSNFAFADRLVGLAGGKCVEEGTPGDLAVRVGGVYAEYVRAHIESLPSAGAVS